LPESTDCSLVHKVTKSRTKPAIPAFILH
jgi:hypothetical protein